MKGEDKLVLIVTDVVPVIYVTVICATQIVSSGRSNLFHHTVSTRKSQSYVSYSKNCKPKICSQNGSPCHNLQLYIKLTEIVRVVTVI